MRIALIGDLQYSSAEEEQLSLKFSQISAAEPDFAVIMGDFGGPHINSPEGFEDTRKIAESLCCDYAVLLGNHDVEYRVGCYGKFDPVAAVSSIFGKEPYFSAVMNGVLVICITCEPQPPEEMRTVNAVYVSDRQYDLIRQRLTENPNIPAMIIAHPPMAGSGLRCTPPLHCAATDTYLDQTFDSLRWQRLTEEFPQIKAWCSAHLHLGHDYASAITEKNGVYHISCGVMTRCSRDGSRHTRIIDITDDGKLLVYTLDHEKNGSLRYDAAIDLRGTEPPSGLLVHAKRGEVLLGGDTPRALWHCEMLGRYYIHTQNGLLWEYLCELDELSGAIALNTDVTELYFDGERLIMALGDGTVRSVDANSADRFERIGSFSHQITTEAESAGLDPLPRCDYSVRSEKEGLYIDLRP